MSMQGWIVLGAALAAVLFFGRKLFDNLDRKGGNAGCGCSKGGCCGKTDLDEGEPRGR